MSVGTNIRRFRKAKGLTQKQLSELANVSVVSIQRYETDKTAPKIEHLKSIARSLNVTVNELIGKDIFDYWDKSLDIKKISKEAAILDTVSETHGKEAADLLSDYLSLNDLGKQKAAEYVSDLTEQKKYKK